MTTGKSVLRIGYAGPHEEVRAKSFLSFFEEHFADVTLLPVTELRTIRKDFDVLVVDNSGQTTRHPINNDAAQNIVVPQMSTYDFPGPTLFLGGLGNWLASQAGLMIGQGCIKLAGPALTPSTDHPVFVGLDADAIHDVSVADCLPHIGSPGPDGQLHSRLYPDADGTARQIDVTTPWPESQEEQQARLRALVTSAPVGAPDFEWICGGLQNDAPDGATICRQGRFLSWGFSEAPENLTPAGRTMLVNAIRYIAGFAGEEPTTFRVASSRRTIPALREQTTPEFIARMLPPGMECPPHLRNQLMEMSRNGLIKELGDEESAAVILSDDWEAWWNAREPYLRWVGPTHGGHLVVDEDAQALGIGLGDPAILDRCVADLEAATAAGDTATDEAARAVRLLQRLTLLDHTAASDWRAWLDAHRDEASFQQTSGYRYVWPGAPALRPFESGPSREPVEHLLDCTGSVQVVGMANPDDPQNPEANLPLLQIRLWCLVAPGHEIYVTEGTPLSIDSVEGSDFEPVGCMGPAPVDGRLSGHFYLVVTMKGEGIRSKLKLTYQTWSAEAGDGPVRELVLPPLLIEEPVVSDPPPQPGAEEHADSEQAEPPAED